MSLTLSPMLHSFFPGLPCLSAFRGYKHRVMFQTISFLAFGIVSVMRWRYLVKGGWHPRPHSPLTLFVVVTRFVLAAVARTICEGFRCVEYDAGDDDKVHYLLVDLSVDCDSQAYKVNKWS
jgi:hypothetical protein